MSTPASTDQSNVTGASDVASPPGESEQRALGFRALSLTGFKSFVDPTEAVIEPGLTGVVGPNGCGKSNLLEALRWVMGATSAKAMRAGGMDDVIFSGSDTRPARTHAEVAITLDNSARIAPAMFNDADELVVVRRISRGAGSNYRVNGAETRARDVQLLFADASTGANSPALVRQGQINELIAAKPQNRRRVLEEAAGVAGLRARRHEAELRLRAAEANLERMEDAAGDVERRLTALKRQARQAKRYARLSDDILALQVRRAAIVWAEAREDARNAGGARQEADVTVAAAAEAASQAEANAATAGEAVTPAREAEKAAALVRARARDMRDAAARQLSDAEAAIERLTAQEEDVRAQAERAAARREDAYASNTAAGTARSALPAANEDANAVNQAKDIAEAMEAARRAADQAADALAQQLADCDAQRKVAERALESAASQLKRAEAARAALNAAPPPSSDEAERVAQTALGAVETCDAQARVAETKREGADATASNAEKAERAASATEAETQANLGALEAEITTLERLLVGALGAEPNAARMVVTVSPGYEHAAAAAFGDELEASLNPDAERAWTGEAAPPDTPLPSGAEPLSDVVEAPAPLRARLSQIGVVPQCDGADLAKKLAPGQRLVSREGGLWRWDGYRLAPGAQTSGAARFEAQNRRAAAETERATAQRTHARAAKRASKARDALRAATTARVKAVQAEHQARSALEAARREASTAETAAQTARNAQAAFNQRVEQREEERASAKTAVQRARKTLEEVSDRSQTAAALDAARARAASAREADADARAKLEAARTIANAHAERRSELDADMARWSERLTTAEEELKTLKARAAALASELKAAMTAPEMLQTALENAEATLAGAEKTRAEAADALVSRETEARDANARARETAQTLAEARETRAAADARREAATRRLEETLEEAERAYKLDVDALERALDEPGPEDSSSIDAALTTLMRDRDALGAVNLRASEEAEELETTLSEMAAEREDVAEAVRRLRAGVGRLSGQARQRIRAAFDIINARFSELFTTLFDGGEAELALVDSDDPLEAGLDVRVRPPGKRLGSMSLMSGGEQALTATALIFAVFLANPAPICALDEVDAPLDDANVDRFCRLLEDMRARSDTRFLVITHNPVTMARMDRLYGVTMAERGVSQLVSVDLQAAERLVAAE